MLIDNFFKNISSKSLKKLWYEQHIRQPMESTFSSKSIKFYLTSLPNRRSQEMKIESQIKADKQNSVIVFQLSCLHDHADWRKRVSSSSLPLSSHACFIYSSASDFKAKKNAHGSLKWQTGDSADLAKSFASLPNCHNFGKVFTGEM